MIRAILFDIDDTLFPSTEFAESARRNAIRAMISMGIHKEENELYAMLIDIIKKKGSNYQNHFDLLCRELGEKRPARYIAAAVGAYHNTKTAIQPYPEVPKTLLSLRESGYKLYIASNGEAIKQWDKLIRLQLAIYFEDVFVSEELGEEKSQSFFRKALKRIGCKPEEALMVGDREDADIVPAKAIGIKTARMLSGKFKSNPSVADFQINRISEIPTILKSLK
jgi:putative hydrolase of the HAD superfamily